MADLNNLGLNEEELDAFNPDEVPEERGPRTPLPQPGKLYTWQLPEDISGCWETFMDGDNLQRVALMLIPDGDAERELPPAALWLVRGEGDLTPYRARLTNLSRNRKIGGVEMKVNQLGYLLKALGETVTFKHNKDYVNAMNKHAGEAFRASVDWTAWCNDSRPVYTDEGQQDQTGCGQRYATRRYKRGDGSMVEKIPQEQDGSWKETFTCKCGARLNCFMDLQGFKAIE